MDDEAAGPQPGRLLRRPRRQLAAVPAACSTRVKGLGFRETTAAAAHEKMDWPRRQLAAASAACGEPGRQRKLTPEKMENEKMELPPRPPSPLPAAQRTPEVHLGVLHPSSTISFTTGTT